MGLMQRFNTIVKAKASKMLDRAEDPRETLDYSYERQVEMLQKVRRGVPAHRSTQRPFPARRRGARHRVRE